MIKSVYLFIMSLFILTPIYSSTGNGPTQTVAVSNIRIVNLKNRVKISFTAEIDNKAVQSNYTLTLTPVLINGTNQAELRPLVVQGRKARIAAERQGMQAKNQSSVLTPIYGRNGNQVLYLDETIYETWMEGAQLVMQKDKEGCCNIESLPTELLADRIEMRPTQSVINIPEVSVPTTDNRTIGDKLAERHPFLVNVDRPSGNKEDMNSAVVYYFVNQTNKIDKQYLGNETTLDDLSNSINTISASNNCRIERIEIVGFASPEGSLALNTQLALKRAISLKDYLIEHSTAKDDAFVLTNGQENWNGLREMVVASDMPEKERILSIIDNAPIWDAKTQTGRLGQLMRLNQGEPYKYMAKNFFPKLRNATCVKIYYKNLE